MASLIAMAKAPLRDPSRSMIACLNRLSSSSGISTLILTMITRFHQDIITPVRLYINYALLIEWSNRVNQGRHEKYDAKLDSETTTSETAAQARV
jgi:hypothetical protein